MNHLKTILCILTFSLMLLNYKVEAQIENVIVETYYISDSLDATDTTGGYLEQGSTTYRIYIDLVAGSKLSKVYGDANHALVISSTASFFNNIVDGQTFAKEFPKNRLLENTVALDTWLTIGQTTRNSAKTYFGVLKGNDNDGSFIGGANNDGGSAAIPTGLLANADPLAGIPLTSNDGMDTLTSLPANWGNYGILDSLTNVDSTIFGSLKQGSHFFSNNVGLFNSGVCGVLPDSNQVLVAQLTTKGEISFELNVEVMDTAGVLIKYVANDSVLLPGEIVSRNLKYPYEVICGCPDARYLEYIADRDCDSQDSCKTLIVFGCMDINACNYNPNANFPIDAQSQADLCCYPGLCNDRDIGVVCPSMENRKASINLYPNPAGAHLNLEVMVDQKTEVTYAIYNSFGRMMVEESRAITPGSVVKQIDISSLNAGLYLFHVNVNGTIESKIFLKN